MWKMKLLLLGLLATLACNACAATVASAEETRDPIEGRSENFKIQTEIVGKQYTIACTESVSPTSKNSIGEEGALDGATEAKKCKVENGKEETLTGCKVREPLEAKFTGEVPAEGEYLFKGSGKEELFAEATIEGSPCEPAGTYQMKGSQTCTLSENSVIEAAHDFVCAATGSKLKIGPAAAKLVDTEVVKLHTGGDWDMTKTSNITVDNTSVKDLHLEEFALTRTFTNRNLWFSWRPLMRKVTSVSKTTSVWTFADGCTGARTSPGRACSVEVKFKANLEPGLFESILEMEDSTSSAFVTMEGEF